MIPLDPARGEPSPSRSLRGLLLGGAILLVLLILVSSYASLLRAQVGGPPSQESVVTGGFLGSLAPAGSHTLSFRLEDRTAGTTLAERTLAFSIISPTTGDGGGGGGGGAGGGGGGDGGGGGTEETSGAPSRSPHTFLVEAERAAKITGRYSGRILIEQGAQAVKLAKTGDSLTLQVRLPQKYAACTIALRAKDDRPGSVQLRVDLDGRTLKTLTLNTNTDRFRILPITTLRNFQRGTLRITFLKDAFDRQRPTDEARDRNGVVDWVRLSCG